MKWVRDRTGRFYERPYYTQHEIDTHCEDVVSGFLRARGRSPEEAVSTDDLAVLIEGDVSELDLYANLAGEGRDVEGVTEFHRRQKPSVRIAKYLSAQPARENRLRSTLAHEYGHVMFHNFLWTLDPSRAPAKSRRRRNPRCRRAGIVVAPQTDWIEWQAGYAEGALLMPITPLRELVGRSLQEWGLRRVEAGTDRHGRLVKCVSDSFAVSRAAAETRLHKLGYVSSSASGATA